MSQTDNRSGIAWHDVEQKKWDSMARRGTAEVRQHGWTWDNRSGTAWGTWDNKSETAWRDVTQQKWDSMARRGTTEEGHHGGTWDNKSETAWRDVGQQKWDSIGGTWDNRNWTAWRWRLSTSSGTWPTCSVREMYASGRQDHCLTVYRHRGCRRNDIVAAGAVRPPPNDPRSTQLLLNTAPTRAKLATRYRYHVIFTAVCRFCRATLCTARPMPSYGVPASVTFVHQVNIFPTFLTVW